MIRGFAHTAFMLARDPAVAADDERRGKRFDPAVCFVQIVVAEDNAVVDLVLRDVRLDHLPAVVIKGNAQHFEVLILILLLEAHEPGDLDFAWTAPGRPEVQEYD